MRWNTGAHSHQKRAHRWHLLAQTSNSTDGFVSIGELVQIDVRGDLCVLAHKLDGQQPVHKPKGTKTLSAHAPTPAHERAHVHESVQGHAHTACRWFALLARYSWKTTWSPEPGFPQATSARTRAQSDATTRLLHPCQELATVAHPVPTSPERHSDQANTRHVHALSEAART